MFQITPATSPGLRVGWGDVAISRRRHIARVGQRGLDQIVDAADRFAEAPVSDYLAKAFTAVVIGERIVVWANTGLLPLPCDDERSAVRIARDRLRRLAPSPIQQTVSGCDAGGIEALPAHS